MTPESFKTLAKNSYITALKGEAKLKIDNIESHLKWDKEIYQAKTYTKELLLIIEELERAITAPCVGMQPATT